MFVILTSKPGQFHTELADGMREIESYDYLFCGRKRAQFVIAEIAEDARITIVDESSPPVVNRVPAKFLPRFDSVDKARRELQQLVRFGRMDLSLVKR